MKKVVLMIATVLVAAGIVSATATATGRSRSSKGFRV
jgi:hypothetical protein